jgi:single-strand DNA-binding protein
MCPLAGAVVRQRNWQREAVRSARVDYYVHRIETARRGREETPEMLNKVMLIGRLGSDPELRYAQSGKAVTKFRIATDSGWGDNKQTDWHQVVCFDKTAENAAKYLEKGRQVYVEGRVSYRKWQKDDGTSTWFTDILAHDVRFLGTNGQPSSKQPSPASGSSSAEFNDGFGNDDDIPF